MTMRIAYIAAGAGDTYCGACARDAILVRGIIRRGHNALLIPLYTPLKLEDGGLPTGPLFFGGVNVYLQQLSGLFRRLPRSLDRILDRPAFLRWISRYAVEVDPRRLGPMTVSVLAGRDGRQAKEVERLMAYLQGQYRPQVVNLTNSLLSALAPEIRLRLGVPVICTYQGEAQFVSELPEPHQSRARQLIRDNSQHVDLFICPCDAMVEEVAAFLGVATDSLRVIRTAIETVDVDPNVNRPAGPLTIGYLSAIRPAKGLDVLVAAAGLLFRQGMTRVRLLIAGRVADRAYWQDIRKQVAREGLEDAFEYAGEVDGAGKRAMLGRCHVLAVPSRYPEPRGVAALEAMAAGVPVVAPAKGVFPELCRLGGGIVLAGEGNATDFSNAIEELLRDENHTHQLGRMAQTTVRRHCRPADMAARTLELYEDLLTGRHTPQAAARDVAG